MSNNDRNTGDRNAGNWNVGGLNVGDRNVGNRNTGDLNAGSWNTGDLNAGSWNTGNMNVGYLNTGHLNVGNRNAGSWNVCDLNTGFFNTTTPETINCFNAPTSLAEWSGARKPDWIYAPRPTSWVPDHEMTDAEKAENPTFHTCGGYLRTNDMAEEWRKAYEGASEEDIQAVRDLPNFDPDVFEEITGLDLRQGKAEICTEKVIEIDGKKYRLEEIK